MGTSELIDRNKLIEGVRRLEEQHFAKAKEYRAKASEHWDARAVYKELKNVYRHAGTVLYCLRVVLEKGEEENLVAAFDTEWKGL